MELFSLKEQLHLLLGFRLWIKSENCWTNLQYNQSSTATSCGCTQQQQWWIDQTPISPAHCWRYWFCLDQISPQRLSSTENGLKLSTWSLTGADAQVCNGKQKQMWTYRHSGIEEKRESVQLGWERIYFGGRQLFIGQQVWPDPRTRWTRPNPLLLWALFKLYFLRKCQWVESGFLGVCYTPCQNTLSRQEVFSTNSPWAWQASCGWIEPVVHHGDLKQTACL